MSVPVERVVRALGVLGLLGLPACTDGPPVTAETAAFTVRDSAGIEIVENWEPVWGEGEGWTIDPDPVLQIGALEGDEPYIFARFNAATLLGDGSIALVEFETREIRLFGPDGRHQATFGGSGDGPGEFAIAPFLAPGATDTLLAWDARQYRLTWFTLDGEVAREASLRAGLTNHSINTGIGGFRWEVRADGTLLVRDHRGSFSFPPEEGLSAERQRILLILDLAREVRELGDLPWGDTWLAPMSSGAMAGRPYPFGPLSAVALHGGETPVVIADSLRWELGLFGADGGARRLIRAAVPRIPIGEAVIAAYHAEALTDRTGAPVTQAIRVFEGIARPDSIPAIASIIRATDGHLWVGRRTGAVSQMGTVHAFDLLDPDGRWLGSVGIPEDIDHVFEIGPDYLLASWEDEYEVPYVRMYRIEKGG